MGRTVNHICPVQEKHRYAGPTEAGKVAAKMTFVNKSKAEKYPVAQAYYCEHCIGWHVGHAVMRMPK